MSFIEFFKAAIEQQAKDLQQGMVCRIEKFNSAKMRADVQPIYKLTRGDKSELDFPILPDLPVGFLWTGGYYIKPVYEKGDMVWVTFATRDIDDALAGKSRPFSKKAFDLENASVAYGIAPKAWTPPADFSDSGLLIGASTGGKARIQLEDSKITLKVGNSKIEISASGINFTTPTGTNTWAGHQHPTAATGPPSPPIPGT